MRIFFLAATFLTAFGGASLLTGSQAAPGNDHSSGNGGMGSAGGSSGSSGSGGSGGNFGLSGNPQPTSITPNVPGSDLGAGLGASAGSELGTPLGIPGRLVGGAIGATLGYNAPVAAATLGTAQGITAGDRTQPAHTYGLGADTPSNDVSPGAAGTSPQTGAGSE